MVNLHTEYELLLGKYEAVKSQVDTDKLEIMGLTKQHEEEIDAIYGSMDAKNHYAEMMAEMKSEIDAGGCVGDREVGPIQSIHHVFPFPPSRGSGAQRATLRDTARQKPSRDGTRYTVRKVQAGVSEEAGYICHGGLMDGLKSSRAGYRLASSLMRIMYGSVLVF